MQQLVLARGEAARRRPKRKGGDGQAGGAEESDKHKLEHTGLPPRPIGAIVVNLDQLHRVIALASCGKVTA